MRTAPDDNAQTVYFLQGGHDPVADLAVLDANGMLWYRVQFGGEGWVRADQMTVFSGTCPEPD